MKVFFSFFFLLFISNTNAQGGHFKVGSNDFVQIGYDTYKSLTLGVSTGTPNNGNWALEHFNGGLNFWKPWPTASTRNYALFIKDNPNYVGIGKQPYHALDVNGDIATYGTIRIYSDERLKKDIKKLTPAYCNTIINSINTYSYHLALDRLPNDYSSLDIQNLTETKKETIAAEQNDKSIWNHQESKLRHGFLAQELEAVAPDLVKTDAAGHKSIDQMALIPIMLESIKQQQKEIEALKEEIKKLK